MNREPPKQQITRVAQKALAAYDLPPVTPTFIGDSENVTFRVDVPQSPRRYLLRLHKPHHNTEETVWSEAAWLSALRAETDIVAPLPILNWGGQAVTPLPAPETPLCTLMEWVEGRFFSDQHAPSRAFRAGETLARLHRHGETWERPPGWTRPRHNAQRLQKHLETYRQAAVAGLLSRNDWGVVEAAAERVYAVMGEVGEAPSDFGLIHGDFHNRNYLFHKGQVRPIDFSFCGDGFYLADLSYALCSLWHRSVFLNGYESFRPLPQEHRPLIETFMVSGILGETAFHLRNARERGQPFEHPTWLVTSLRDKFLRGKRFLTDW